jgi:hypothetical protein
VFELLPILARSMPPNSLRGPLERCLAHAWAAAATGNQDSPFVLLLRMLRECLDAKIHDANRTLIAQIVENYFTVIPDTSFVSTIL